MLDFNFSEFITNNKLILDGKKLSNYRISGIRKESVEIKRCIMENMVFENDFEGDVVFIEECTFINCKFFDVFKREELLLLIMNIHLEIVYLKMYHIMVIFNSQKLWIVNF